MRVIQHIKIPQKIENFRKELEKSEQFKQWFQSGNCATVFLESYMGSLQAKLLQSASFDAWDDAVADATVATHLEQAVGTIQKELEKLQRAAV